MAKLTCTSLRAVPLQTASGRALSNPSSTLRREWADAENMSWVWRLRKGFWRMREREVRLLGEVKKESSTDVRSRQYEV